MKLILVIICVLSVLPALAFNKECLIPLTKTSKELNVSSPSQIIPIFIFLSSSEKLEIQIGFKEVEVVTEYDHLVISSNDCSVTKYRNDNTEIKQLDCWNITQGWQQADINITPTVLGVGHFLNYSLHRPISKLVATANYYIDCKEKSPTWNVTETADPIKIPLSGQSNVNIILVSQEQFSPILHIMGSIVSLSWKKKSISITHGPPLPKGQYNISIYDISEQVILTVSSSEYGCETRLPDLVDPLDELGISSTKGSFYCILIFNGIKEFSEIKEPHKKKTPREGNSNDAILITLTSVFGCMTLATILVCVYIVRKNMQRMQKKERDIEEKPLINSKEDKIPRKVDIKGIIENFSEPADSNTKALQIYKLKMEIEHHNSEIKVQKLSLGSLESYIPTKSILILGETGTGKSSTINTMVNYIFGIELEDVERFILIENDIGSKTGRSESQTEFMTAYVLPYQEGMPNICNYVIIDTPGFGDTRGFERDQQIMLQLKDFLKQDYAISHIDIVGFVVKAFAPRLTIPQRYIYDGLFSMFGKDISHNMFVLVTSAGPEEPPVLKVLNDADIKYHDYFKMNNDSLYQTYKEDIENDNQSFEIHPEIIKANWYRTNYSLETLFEKIPKITPVSLSLTKIVLEENTRLRSVVGYLQKQIREGSDKISQLKARQIESENPKDTLLIQHDIRHTEELLVNSINEAQQLTERLTEIPLRLDPLSVHGYIDLLISNEKKEMFPNYEDRIAVLEKLKEQNEVLKSVINQEQKPGESWLDYFQKLKDE